MGKLRIGVLIRQFAPKPKPILTLIRRIHRIYQEFATQKCHLKFHGFHLTDGEGRVFGKVHDVTFKQGRMHIRGTARNTRLGIAIQNGFGAAPHLMEASIDDDWGDFRLGYRADCARADLMAQRGELNHLFSLPVLSQRQLRAMRRWLPLTFAVLAIRLVPHALHWQFSRSPRAAARIRSGLGLLSVDQAPDLPAVAPTPTDRDSLPSAPVSRFTIIMNAATRRQHLAPVLSRLLANTDLNWQLLIIADRAKHPRAADVLVNWTKGLPDVLSGRVRLFENGQSDLGAALDIAAAAAAPLVWMQGKAILPHDWASRLLQPLLCHRGISSVIPLCGSAELDAAFGPEFPPGQSEAEADELDAAVRPLAQSPAPGALMLHQAPLIAVAPRAIAGFRALLLSSDSPESLYTSALRRLSGRHLQIGNIFVGCLPDTSRFDCGSEKIPEQVPRDSAVIRDWNIQKNLLAHRLALHCALAGLRQSAPVPVYLAHNMGGGAELYLSERIQHDISEGASAIVLRVGGARRWQLELHRSNGCISGATDSLDVVEQLLGTLPHKRIIYSCGVGDVDPYSLPEALLRLARSGQDCIEVLMHDYFPLSPSFNLLGQDGRYRGLPCRLRNTDPAHETVRPDGTRITLDAWCTAWDRLLHAADQITVFSENSRNLVAQACPQIAPRLSVQPHQLRVSRQRAEVRPSANHPRKPVIGVLGNVNFHKGAAVLQDLSHLLARTGQAELVIIGNSDPAYPMSAPAQTHGSYSVEDIAELAMQYGIDHWLMPSIWPETFHYATQEALATGLPVFTFDIGAQADSVKAEQAKSGRGGTIPLDASSEDILCILLGDEVALARAA